MRIEWLDAERTRALLVTGHLWWRRAAEVKRTSRAPPLWLHVPSGDEVDEMNMEIERAHAIGAAMVAERRSRNWRRPSTLPKARVVDRG
jgi:hypothetical protein